MDELDRKIINALQGGFPLSHAPFDDAGAMLGIDPDELIERLKQLLSTRTITRFGPLFQVERMGGVFVLAALQVPRDVFGTVASLVNAHPEVAHNYARDHALNMWFVIAAESHQQVDSVLRAIAAETGLEVHAFPKEREYFVEMLIAA